MYYHTRDCSHGIATRRHPRIALASLSVVLYYQFTPQLYLSGTFFFYSLISYTSFILPYSSYLVGVFFLEKSTYLGIGSVIYRAQVIYKLIITCCKECLFFCLSTGLELREKNKIK